MTNTGYYLPINNDQSINSLSGWVKAHHELGFPPPTLPTWTITA